MTGKIRFLVNGGEVELISSKVKRNSDRAVDTIEFKIPPKQVADQGATVTYVQDIVNTDFLTAIYNFQYSARDESGNDLDGDDGVYTADYTEDSTQSYTENIKPVIRFNADSEKVTITDNTLFDFSKQFDIILITKPSTFPTGAMTIFSKTNGGIGGGIEIGLTSGDPSYVEVELFETGGTLTTITGSNVNIRDNVYHVIRVKRDENGLITVTVDGTLEGSTTKNGAADDYSASGIDVFIGKNSSVGTKHYYGTIAQLRIYCGGYVSDNDYTNIRFYKRQPLTMKFKGIVQNYEDSVGFRTVYAQSINELLINAIISKEVLDARDKSGTNNGIDNIFLDDSGGTRMRTDTIVTQILAELDSEYLFYTAAAAGTIMNRYIARGTLSTIVSQLFALDNRDWWITPRKVFIKEAQPITTSLTILEGDYDITVDGKDSTNLINDIEGIGEIQIHNKTQLFNGDTVETNFTLTFTPIRSKVSVDSVEKIRGFDSSDSVGKDYYIEYTDGATSGAQLIFFSPPASGTNNISIEYDYEATDTLYFRGNDATSITANGRVSGRFYAPGFDQSQLATLVNNILTNRKDANRRIHVISSSLCNFIREGLQMNIIYSPKVIDDNFELKSMEWLYPQGITIMEFGEHKFDYFDIMKSGNERALGLDNSIVKTNSI